MPCCSHCLSQIAALLDDYPNYSELRDDLERLQSNYDLLVNCYKSGVMDPQRNSILDTLHLQLVRLFSNLSLMASIEENSFLGVARKRAAQLDLLQVGERLPQKQGDLEWYNMVFSAILVSWQWDDHTQQYFTELLSRPDIDSVFALLMVSAISLSCYLEFDNHQFNCLVDIYQGAQDEVLKQRALVGFAFCYSRSGAFDLKDTNKTLGRLLENPDFCQTWQDLQKQVIICMDAEKDSTAVDREILSSIAKSKMPRFMKDDMFEETPVDEILNPEEEEEVTEKLEKTVRNMISIQKAGGDIYYSGFSKMKSFAFFHRLSNWFLPFFANNPSLSSFVSVMDGDDSILKAMEKSYTFCESDKYSFVFAMEQTFKNSTFASLKPYLKDTLFLTGEQSMDLEVDMGMFDRRRYLQDLIRFFNVSPFKAAFCNPFNEIVEDKPSFKGYFVSISQVFFQEKVEPMCRNICRFLVKRRDYRRLLYFIVNRNFLMEDEDIWYEVLYEVHSLQSYESALSNFSKFSEAFRQTPQCLRLKAKCEMLLGQYDDAEKDYQSLQSLKPSASNQLKIAYCQLEQDKVEEAMAILFELDYKYPNNIDIMRSLAWGQLHRHNVDAAFALYQKLQTMAEPDSDNYDVEDIYNIGICHWAKHEVKEAFHCMEEYLKNDSSATLSDLKSKLIDDMDLLAIYGIDDWDISLMVDNINAE